MIRLRTLGLALVAAFAMSAVAVASASAALPELVNKGGKELTKKGFTSEGKAGETYILETVGGQVIECKSLSNTGKVTGLKTDVVTVKFDECKSVTLDEPCTSTEAKAEKEGEIWTTELESELVYIKKAAPKEVGIVLKPKAGSNFTTFECSGIPIVVKGSVIGVITPINKLVKTTEHFTLAFTQAGGIQKPTEYENAKGEKVKDVLETSIAGGAFEQSGESATAELKYEEEAKINA